MKRIVLCMLLGLLISTAAHSATGKYVIYTVKGEPYEGYYVSPSPKAPLVLLIHDWDGLTDYEVERSNMLAEKGYAVFAADLYGKGVRPTKVADKRQHTGELYTDREKMRALMVGALKEARKQGGDTRNTVALGYCFGGAAVLELARSGAGLKGFSSFHGGLQTPEGQSYKETKGRLIVFHGSADKNITMDHFASLAQQLEEANIPHEMITYGGAPHAFSVFGSKRYRKEADRASWNRFLIFLEKVLRH